MTYLPDQEPALGAETFPFSEPEWTSGGMLAQGADLLIHDSQYSAPEYEARVGWGHSSLRHMLQFGALARAKHVVPFHHDPSHSDRELDRLMGEAMDEEKPRYEVTPGREGMVFEV